MVDNWLIAEGVGDIKVKRTGKVITILCAGMIGIGVLTGCSQTNGNGATNGSTGSGGNVVNSVSATSQKGTQEEIVQLKSMQVIVSTLATMQNGIIKAAQMYTEQNGNQYNAEMAKEFNDTMTQVSGAISAEEVKFNDMFANSKLANEQDEALVTDDISNLLQDMQKANQELNSGIVDNSTYLLNEGLNDEQTVVNDISTANGKISDELSKLGAN